MPDYQFTSYEEGIRHLGKLRFRVEGESVFPDPLPKDYPVDTENQSHPIPVAILDAYGNLDFDNANNPYIKEYHKRLRKDLGLDAIL